MSDRLLVTGGSGLLGSAVVGALLADGRTVRALVRDEAKARLVLGEHERLEIVIGDVTDPGVWNTVLTASGGALDGVVHCAAFLAEYLTPADGEVDLPRLHQTNVTAVGDLLDAADRHGVGVVVYVSSSSVYEPEPNPSVTSELSGPKLAPDPYMQSKLDAERLIDEFTGQVRVPIVQPGWIWGPGDASVGSAGRIVQGVAAGKLPAVPNCANTIVDSRDAAAACLAALTKGEHARRYLIAGLRSPLPVTTGLVAETLGRRKPLPMPAWFAMGMAGVLELGATLTRTTPLASRHEMKIVVLEDKIQFSNARVEQELGVTLRPLSQTVRDTVAWYREHGLLS